MKKRRRNDAPWRSAVLALRGECCRRCGSGMWIQIDHVMPRSQGGPSVVENGSPLCHDCHLLKTENRIQYDRAWLDPDQIAWLAEIGYVSWDGDGMPYGRGMRHFAPIPRGEDIGEGGTG